MTKGPPSRQLASLLSAIIVAALQISLSAQGVNEDMSKGASFSFRIAPTLPEFTFKIVPEVNPEDGHGNAQSTIKQIEVYRDDSDKPSQRLEGCDLAQMEAPPNGSDWFHAEDFNFDGYQDISVTTWWGATGNHGGCIWLYIPRTGRFEYSKELSELPWRLLDGATKTIFTFENGGAAGSVYDANRYRVENNKPVRIWHEHQDWDNDKNQFHCTAEELKGNKMGITKDLWSKPSRDWSKIEAPCDQSRFFP